MKEINDVIQQQIHKTLLTSQTRTYLQHDAFPTISKQKYYNWLLTLGFLEVVEMEYDEGSE